MMASPFYFITLLKENPLNSYIRPVVKIELGARGANSPTNLCTIIPFIEELIPGTLMNDSIQIKTLAAERTFWEKATILHMYAHWPEGKALPERQSRHFFDFYKLLQSKIKNLAISHPQLLESVAQHKKIFFRAAWAKYEKAIKGTLILIPKKTLLDILENDYNKMQAMFYGKSVTWNTIIDEIKQFENEFNNKKLSLSRLLKNDN